MKFMIETILIINTNLVVVLEIPIMSSAAVVVLVVLVESNNGIFFFFYGRQDYFLASYQAARGSVGRISSRYVQQSWSIGTTVASSPPRP